MRTKSKSKFLAGILSIFAIILCFGFLLTGCGDSSNNDNTGDDDTSANTSIISLVDAKNIIINALAIDDAESTPTLPNSQAKIDNRDIFVKFGKSAISLFSDIGYPGDGSVINASASIRQAQISFLTDKTSGELDKYLIEGSIFDGAFGEPVYSTALEYLDGEFVYSNYDGVINRVDYTGNITEGVLFNYASQLLIYETIFSDSAFDSIYQQQVEREDFEEGFSLTLDTNIYEYFIFMLEYNYTIMGMPNFDQSAFEEILGETMINMIKNEGSATLTITFDNNGDIVSLNMKMNMFTQINDDIIPNNSVVTIEKYTGDITEPQWVTEYLAQQQ